MLIIGVVFFDVFSSKEGCFGDWVGAERGVGKTYMSRTNRVPSPRDQVGPRHRSRTGRGPAGPLLGRDRNESKLVKSTVRAS